MTNTNLHPSAAQTWLLLGGTGTISTGVVKVLLEEKVTVTCINRGNQPMPPAVEALVGDVNNDEDMARMLAGRYFDVVVDFLTYGPGQAEKRTQQFQGKCGRYVFISTAMTYEKPPRTPTVSETTPQGNPFSPYATNKIACEGIFRAAMKENGFPLTIIRPSCTYGHKNIPFTLNSGAKPFTLIDRMRKGMPILVPGDGNIFWTITHNSDFGRALLGLMRCAETLGEDFHLTQDECMTWDSFAKVIAEEAGAPAPKLVHVATDVLARSDARLVESVVGDMGQNAVFDNSKLRRYLPGFKYLTPFRQGIRQSIDWYDAHPEMQQVDDAWNAWVDEMIAKHG